MAIHEYHRPSGSESGSASFRRLPESGPPPRTRVQSPTLAGTEVTRPRVVPLPSGLPPERSFTVRSLDTDAQEISSMAPVPQSEVDQAAKESRWTKRIFRGRREEDTIDPGRRALLKGIVATSGTLLVAKTGLEGLKFVMDIDEQQTEKHLVPREGNVQFVNRDTRDKFPLTTSLFYRGFNVDQIDNAAQAMAPYVSRYGQVAAIDYGNQTFDLGEITERTIDFCKKNNIYRVNIWGKSMGGMVGLEMVEPLREARIKVESVLFDSTPASSKEVIGARDSDAYFIELYNNMVKLGYASYGGDRVRNFVEKRVNDVMRDRDPRKEAIGRKSENELPNNIVLQQAGFIGTFDVNPTMAKLLEGVPVGYFGAEKGIGDTTVDVLRSCDHLRERLPGCNVKLYELPGIWHASSGDHPDIYGPAAIKFREDFKLPLEPAA